MFFPVKFSKKFRKAAAADDYDLPELFAWPDSICKEK